MLRFLRMTVHYSSTALALQVYRGHRGRLLAKELRRQEKAAVALQSGARMFLARKRVGQIAIDHKAAASIQASFRGYILRLARYEKLCAIHSHWAALVTRVNKHYRGWSGRRAAEIHKEMKRRQEFEQDQVEQEVVRSMVQLAKRRCHFYLKSVQGKEELRQERKRTRLAGPSFTFAMLRGIPMDGGILKSRLLEVFKLFDPAETGYIAKDQAIYLLAFLGVQHQPAEIEALLARCTKIAERTMPFEAFYDWYERYHSIAVPKLQDRIMWWRRRLQEFAWTAADRFIVAAIEQRYCKVARNDILYRSEAVIMSPTFRCCQCRRRFLLYRDLLSHLVPPAAAPTSQADLCPITNRIGMLLVGIKGDQDQIAFQNKVNIEYIRYLDEMALLSQRSHEQEAIQSLEWSLPLVIAEIRVLQRSVLRVHGNLNTPNVDDLSRLQKMLLAQKNARIYVRDKVKVSHIKSYAHRRASALRDSGRARVVRLQHVARSRMRKYSVVAYNHLAKVPQKLARGGKSIATGEALVYLRTKLSRSHIQKSLAPSNLCLKLRSMMIWSSKARTDDAKNKTPSSSSAEEKLDVSKKMFTSERITEYAIKHGNLLADIFKRTAVHYNKKIRKAISRPYQKRLIMAIFSIYSIDGEISTRDLPDLFQALGLRFFRMEKGPLEAVARLDPEEKGWVQFEQFYDWYVGSVKTDFTETLTKGKQSIARYMVKCLIARRNLMQARVAAVEKFRKVRNTIIPSVAKVVFPYRRTRSFAFRLLTLIVLSLQSFHRRSDILIWTGLQSKYYYCRSI